MVIDNSHHASIAPLLKWPGGKRFVLKFLLSIVPKRFDHYYEPFLGGGALFFALHPARAILSDNNAELINFYVQVRDHPNELIDHLQKLHNIKEEYYRIRHDIPVDKIARAARLMYLANLSFNGIFRVNLKGEFNVPYGYKTHLQICDPARIQAASALLASVQFQCDDFEASVQSASAGDLVYLDPPYTLAHQNNGFIKYNSKIFSWDDQIRLANLANELLNRGCKIIVSNANHPSIINLYANFQMRLVERASVIAANSRFRRKTTECIFFSGV